MTATSPVVLIVDDSMVVRAFLKKQLASESFQVVEVESGEAALEISRNSPPDVVLLDVEMPGMSGYDVLTAMQAEPALSPIPVIFLSGRVSASDVATGLRLGAYDYLRKPVETGELVARITKALQTKAMYDKLQSDSPLPAGSSTATDPLTEVLDINGLQDQLRELATVGSGRPLAAVLIDIDGLGKINEAHGQAAGDQVLRAVATLVRERAGPRDVVGRCGPDEFMVLLRDMERSEAETRAKDVRDAVKQSPALGAGHLGISVTVGVAGTPTGDLRDLFLELESSLALAKGGTATVVEPLPAEPVPEPAPLAAEPPPEPEPEATAPPEPEPELVIDEPIIERQPDRPSPVESLFARDPEPPTPPPPPPPPKLSADTSSAVSLSDDDVHAAAAEAARSGATSGFIPPTVVVQTQVGDVSLAAIREDDRPTGPPPVLSVDTPFSPLADAPRKGVMELQEQLKELAAVVRAGRPLAAAHIHVLGLERVDEVHGPSIGEQARRTVASIVAENTGPAGVVGRWGPEEFLVMLPDVGIDDARNLGIKVRAAILNSPAVAAASSTVGVECKFAATASGDLEGLFRDLEAEPPPSI